MSMINVSNLTFAYEGSYDNVFENVSFQIDTDWKLGFTGRNGRGKTTFLNLLMGKYSYSGTISKDVEMEYFPYTVNDTSVMNEPKHCPRCGGFMVKRKGRYGTFYGCTNYPRCNYTERQENYRKPE